MAIIEVSKLMLSMVRRVPSKYCSVILNQPKLDVTKSFEACIALTRRCLKVL